MSRPYIGINFKQGVREVFRSIGMPTPEKYPQYNAVIGPFRTRRGADCMRKAFRCPYCVTVSEAEQLAKLESK